MRDWLMELCPEMVGWQADLIVDHVERLVRHELEECIDLVAFYGGPVDLEAAIRARGKKQ